MRSVVGFRRYSEVCRGGIPQSNKKSVFLKKTLPRVPASTRFAVLSYGQVTDGQPRRREVGLPGPTVKPTLVQRNPKLQ